MSYLRTHALQLILSFIVLALTVAAVIYGQVVWQQFIASSEDETDTGDQMTESTPQPDPNPLPPLAADATPEERYEWRQAYEAAEVYDESIADRDSTAIRELYSQETYDDFANTPYASSIRDLYSQDGYGEVAQEAN